MSHVDLLSAMPAWPALMDAATGALYLEISPASFQALVRRAAIRPVDLGLGVVRWRRSDLDDLVARLPVRGGGTQADVSPPSFEDALARSATRTGKATRRAAAA